MTMYTLPKENVRPLPNPPDRAFPSFFVILQAFLGDVVISLEWDLLGMQTWHTAFSSCLLLLQEGCPIFMIFISHLCRRPYILPMRWVQTRRLDQRRKIIYLKQGRASRRSRLTELERSFDRRKAPSYWINSLKWECTVDSPANRVGRYGSPLQWSQPSISTTRFVDTLQRCILI